MRHLLLACLFAASLLAQGTPFYLEVGPLHCGARMYTATQFQSWCYARQPDYTWKLVHNTIHEVVAGNAVLDGFAQGGDQVVFVVNRLDGEVRWQAISSDAAHNTSPPNYQEGIWSMLDPTIPRAQNLIPVEKWFCCASGLPIESFTFFAMWKP